ncbi:MAG: hypothetical protein Q4Q17_03865 [Tissierellia bacterium]|nr:hypothetical protein [Tissierellia bacterium]
MNNMYWYEENNDFNQSERNRGPKMDVQVVITEDLFELFKDLDELSEDATMEGDKVCPKCGRSLKEIRSSMVVGCQVCYSTFKQEILKILKKKNLLPSADRNDIARMEQLRKELEVAIRTEDYERAEEIKGLLEGNMI